MLCVRHLSFFTICVWRSDDSVFPFCVLLLVLLRSLHCLPLMCCFPRCYLYLHLLLIGLSSCFHAHAFGFKVWLSALFRRQLLISGLVTHFIPLLLSMSQN